MKSPKYHGTGRSRAGLFDLDYKQTILIKKSQIFPIDLWMPKRIDEFVSSFTFDSLFIKLKSIVLIELSSNVLISVLSNLSYLSCLYSVTIRADKLQDLTNIYQLVLALPKLKYYKCYLVCSIESISIPMAINEQFNTIEYLNLSHSFTFDELSAILSYTPSLRHLKFSSEINLTRSFAIILPKTLLNLSYESNLISPTFDETETFISNIQCKLKGLTLIIHSRDLNFFNANRWEQILQEYLPELEIFSFQNCSFIDSSDHYELPIHFQESNKYNSSFWIERQWIFEIRIDEAKFYYIISPYKKRWYENNLHQQIIYSPVEFYKSNQLIIDNIDRDGCYKLVNLDIKHALSVSSFYHLEITEEDIFIGILIQILDLLLELKTLKISTFSMNPPKNLSDMELSALLSIKVKSSISKVYLEEMIDIQQIYFLMNLCPHMEYLKVGDIDNIQSESILRTIFKKIMDDANHYLRLLCFTIPAADDKLIKKLENMINTEQLLINFTIQPAFDDVYIQWKWDT
ncbi:unnamed protein product [Adineta steineri]|uniref:Uncharacterized protein n=1 Tax=Adineta steineri TaxID=433720 RepID=A0A814I598_9BILA|nr:unnamed protein product [Adineta steineri]CAF3716477.1 unnamed protein product [Adineta steineri]